MTRYEVRVFRFTGVRTGETRILPEGWEPIEATWTRLGRSSSINEGTLVIVAKKRVITYR